MFSNENERDKILHITNDILKISKNTLLVNLRFLDLALGQFNNKSSENFLIDTYATDGKYFIYNPIHILKSYQQEKESIPRDYLHLIMHCIFRHMFVSPTIQKEYWNLACDIAVENTITELDISQITTLKSQKQQAVIEDLKNSVKHITAECLYSHFKDNPKLYTEKEIQELSELFYSDNHEYWYKQGGLDSSGKKNNSNGDESQDSNKIQKKSEESEGSGSNNPQNKNNNTSGNRGQNQQQNSQNNKNMESSRNELENRWKDISERVQIDMETFNKQHGEKANSMVQNLKEINREKYDYTSFLKKFATINEVMKINDDEFDYIFYTYGLSLYKKMPLIEPLEYKDEKRIKEFVIAIDTSGSVQGEVVQKFIQKTYNILKSTETFTSKVNIHIIQCDAKLQEDKKITNQEEFDQYLKTMKLHGFGGTDFRPVFSYVQNLIKAKEFTNLKGLLYFTDGYGTFPEKKTPYTTAFVFLDDNYNNYDIPSWAIKLVLKPEEILNANETN